MTNTASHSGTYSGLVSFRTAAWGSARQAVSLENRKTYRVSAWAKLASGSDTGRIVAELTIGGTNYYRTLASGTINSAGWSEIGGEYTFNETAPITSARIYVDTAASTANLYIDDLRAERIETNLVANSGFENGTTGWQAAGASISSSANDPLFGTVTGRVYARTDFWSSARQQLPLANEAAYRVSAWVRLASGSDTGRIMAAVTVNGTTQFRTLATGPVSASGWTEISGVYTFHEAAAITQALVYADTTSTTAELHVDNFRVVPLYTVVKNGGFENGTTNWTTIAGTGSASATSPHGGSYTGLVSGRSYYYSSLRQSVSFVNGQTYRISVWGKLASGTDTANLVAQIVVGGSTYYRTLATGTLGTGWSEIAGTYTFAESGPITSASIYLSTAASTADLYSDDYTIYPE